MRLAILALAALLTSAPVQADELVVLNKTDNTITFVDGDSLEPLETLPTGEGPHEVAISPDGNTAVVCDYGAQSPGRTLSVYDTRKRERTDVIDLGEYRRPHGIQFEDEEHVLVTVEQNRAVIRVHVGRGEVVAAMDTDQAASHMLVLTPDGTRVFTANIGPGTISAIDARSGELLGVIETGAGAEGIDVTPDGKEVWVTNRSADTVSVVDVQELEVLHQLPCPAFPIRAKITPDGEYALVSNPNTGDVTVFHVPTHLEVRRIAMELDEVEEADEGIFGDQFAGSPVPIGILITPDGKRAFIANTNADIVTVLDLESWSVSGRIPTGRQPDGLGWIPGRADSE